MQSPSHAVQCISFGLTNTVYKIDHTEETRPRWCSGRNGRFLRMRFWNRTPLWLLFFPLSVFFIPFVTILQCFKYQCNICIIFEMAILEVGVVL